MDFLKRYNNLNSYQRQAVDTIDGPVMVVAGPGTGKTELLSVRVANILNNTDVLPDNILCLTFTDSGANAMRERLTQIIGKDAYKVAIHTFHSFGSEIINQNSQYFYQGAHFRPADELTSYEIIRSIFDKLEHNNPLSSMMNGEYTHLSDSLTTISELKKSGLNSQELLSILDANDIAISKIEQLLAPIFDKGIKKSTAEEAASNIKAISNINCDTKLATILPLSQIIADSLASAINDAIISNSTKPITAWRNTIFTKNKKGNYVLKSRERQIKLRALCSIYDAYLKHMQEAALYDFDDMIMRVVHAIENNDDLRFNLQEKFQYIIVDEFQDTNMAQMRILHNLTSNEILGNTPNIMVVGDDDQAIYSFQGADISNIIDFRRNYPEAQIITLTDNYRSSSNILSGSRDIITQGSNRLEDVFKDIKKQLQSHNNQLDSNIDMYQAETIGSERHWLVNDIKSKINSGIKPNTIAVLTRRHHEINSLLPYFAKAGIAVNYEKRDNVLDLEPIKLIELVSKVLTSLASGQHDTVNSLMPELLAHPSWRLRPIDIWKLSIQAYEKHTRWLDVMETTPEFTELNQWLIDNATKSVYTPLEQMLDIIIGHPNTKTSDIAFCSPIFDYYFSNVKLTNNPSEYITFLDALRCIRAKLREYQPDSTPSLSTFVNFIAINKQIGNVIGLPSQSNNLDNAINLMTAHKSKGLEFDTVYVINAIDTMWGAKARSRSRSINYPENLQLAPAGETEDERLRLFYVAITRAKHHLNVSYSLIDDNNKNTLKADFLTDLNWNINQIAIPESSELHLEAAELAWYQPIISPIQNNMRDLIASKLENYKLSVTHMHNFLDVSRGGPSMFMVQNLLRFPSAKSPNASFGTAIHTTLQNAHSNIAASGIKQDPKTIINNFTLILKQQHLSEQDYTTYAQKGIDVLNAFLAEKYDSFKPTQRAELNFSNQHSMIGEAHITGSLDLVDIDKLSKEIIVTDYKTGKPLMSWNGKSEYEKIKLHKYRQQLLFYKLLVENARDYSSFKVKSGIMQFVEPTTSGDIISLSTDFSSDDIGRLKLLINAVWEHIKEFNLPDTSSYEPSYKGIVQFEQDLLDGII